MNRISNGVNHSQWYRLRRFWKNEKYDNRASDFLAVDMDDLYISDDVSASFEKETDGFDGWIEYSDMK